MMEVLDTLNGDYTSMRFPETDAFEQELFYGNPTLRITNQGTEWFLAVNNDLEFHVSSEKEQQLAFQWTFRVSAQYAYPDQPVPLEQMDNFFEKTGWFIGHRKSTAFFP